MPRKSSPQFVLLIVCFAVTIQIFPHRCIAQGHNRVAPVPAAASVKVHMERGKSELERKHYAVAVRWFSTVLRRDPANAEAYRLRGTAQDKLGLPQKAVQDFNRYIELKPNDPAGYVGRGDARNFNQEHETALHDYNMAVKLAPSSPAGYLGRGLAYVGLQKYNEAMKEYQWALKLDPNNTEALGNMGVACMLAGRNMEAMSYFEKALDVERDPHWRAQIEKWTRELLQQADAGRPSRGPTREPPKPSSRPPW
ncbi:MAG TPA: tetratricopeptide repeat protein [Desulfomonilaceae bacterium]|nr:tetratricopeptide repeat protein [Desulfomonilaceae bacterium]